MRLLLSQLVFIIGFCFFVSACATLSKKQCEAGNWHKLGRIDGSIGRDIERFDKHQDACSNYGIKADFAAYKKGREQGLQSFCQIHRQFSRGLAGLDYRHVCQGKNVSALIQANKLGFRIYDIKASLYASENQLSKVRDQLRDRKIKKEQQDRLELEERRLLDEIDRLRREFARIKEAGDRELAKLERSF